MTDTNAITAAVAHIKQITPEGETWDWGDFAGPMSPQNQIAFAEIASAVASGALVPAADVQGLQDALRRVTAERDEWQTACSTVSASLAIKVADAEAEVARVTGVAEVDFPDDWRGSMNIKEQRIYSAGFNACRSLIHAVIWPHRALNGGKTDE